MADQSECPNCEKLWQRLREQEEKLLKKTREVGGYQTTVIALIVLSAISLAFKLMR